MIKYFQYLVAYISIVLLWIYIILIILSILDIINFDRGGVFTSTVVAFFLAHLYHRYKPMEFKELIKLIKNGFFTKE